MNGPHQDRQDGRHGGAVPVRHTSSGWRVGERNIAAARERAEMKKKKHGSELERGKNVEKMYEAFYAPLKMG